MKTTLISISLASLLFLGCSTSSSETPATSSSSSSSLSSSQSSSSQPSSTTSSSSSSVDSNLVSVTRATSIEIDYDNDGISEETHTTEYNEQGDIIHDQSLPYFDVSYTNEYKDSKLITQFGTNTKGSTKIDITYEEGKETHSVDYSYTDETLVTEYLYNTQNQVTQMKEVKGGSESIRIENTYTDTTLTSMAIHLGGTPSHTLTFSSVTTSQENGADVENYTITYDKAGVTHDINYKVVYTSSTQMTIYQDDNSIGDEGSIDEVRRVTTQTFNHLPNNAIAFRENIETIRSLLY